MTSKKVNSINLTNLESLVGLDEFYQSFVPERNSLIRDSLIDCGGAIMGLVGYMEIGSVE